MATVLAGSLLGWFAADAFFKSYTATTHIGEPMSPQLYRRIFTELWSAESFQKFAKFSQPADLDALKAIGDQLERNRSRPISIEYSFVVTKSDLRDLPDVLAKTYSFSADQTDVGGVTVHARAATANVALQLVNVFNQYIRYTAFRSIFRDYVLHWTTNNLAANARLELEIAEQKLLLQSIDRRFAALSLLRNQPREADGSPTNFGVQVQVTDPHVLPIGRQIDSLNVQRSEIQEALRLKSIQFERNLMTMSLGKKLSEIINSNAPVPRIVDASLDEISKLASQKKSDAADTTNDAVVAQFKNALISNKVRFLDPPLAGPLLIFDGISKFFSTVVGALLAAGLCYLIMWARGLLPSRISAVLGNHAVAND